MEVIKYFLDFRTTKLMSEEKGNNSLAEKGRQQFEVLLVDLLPLRACMDCVVLRICWS